MAGRRLSGHVHARPRRWIFFRVPLCRTCKGTGYARRGVCPACLGWGY